MDEPEFSRPVDVRQADGRDLRLSANDAERSALATRFDLVRLDRLEAEISLTVADRAVGAKGTMHAVWVQSCAVSAEDLHVSAREELNLRFVPARGDHAPDEELEIDAEDYDEIEYEGHTVDIGEALAQSLGLAIDPYATGPDAESARKILREEGSGPFAALKELNLKK